MTVVQSFVCGRLYNTEKCQPSKGELPKDVSLLLSEAITLNCAYNSMIVEPKKIGERLQQLGNKTECGLLGWVKQIGGDYDEIRREFPEEKLYKGLWNLFLYKLGVEGKIFADIFWVNFADFYLKLDF